MSEVVIVSAVRTPIGTFMGALSTVAACDVHMGVTAENIATEDRITREDQDAFALQSRQRAARRSAPACSTARSSR